MELLCVSDSVGWRQAQCHYPDWLSDYDVWQDLSGKHTYTLDERAEVLRQNYRRKASVRPHTQAAYRCMQAVTTLGHSGDDRPYTDLSNDPDTFIAVAHTLHGWWVLYTCMLMSLLPASLLSIQAWLFRYPLRD